MRPEPSRIKGLPPVSAADARVLILGSMPGQRSLDEQRYYAQPQNLFWDLVGEALGVGDLRCIDYERRLETLVKNRIALWDVIDSCRRRGSMDAQISEVDVNDFGGFLRRHRQLRAIFCNGRKSEELFKQHVLPGLGDRAAELSLRYLPSTSPAHASMTRQAKAESWRILADWLH